MPSPVSISRRLFPVPRRYVLDPALVKTENGGGETLKGEFPRIQSKDANHIRTNLFSGEDSGMGTFSMSGI